MALLLFAPSNASASGFFPLDTPPKLLIGANRTYRIQKRESLVKLAREFGVGYNEIVDANRNIDPWVPDNGTIITIPSSWLLPEVLDDGILINLAEMRLYYFFSTDNRRYVVTYPIGIGKQRFSTPTGDYTIVAKVRDPVWYIPVNIREEEPELPVFVPPGPENPLGGYWLQLSEDGYGIHGTNRPYGIGRRVSHGCIRLYPKDIETLFKFIKPGTPVRILNEPVKAGMYGNKIYIEVHRSGLGETELIALAKEKLSRKHLLEYVDMPLMMHEVNSATGLPAMISK